MAELERSEKNEKERIRVDKMSDVTCERQTWEQERSKRFYPLEREREREKAEAGENFR